MLSWKYDVVLKNMTESSKATVFDVRLGADVGVHWVMERTNHFPEKDVRLVRSCLGYTHVGRRH